MVTELIDVLRRCLAWYEHAVIVYFFAYSVILFCLIVAGFVEMIRHRRITREGDDAAALTTSSLTPPVSILAPAFNEAAGIRESVRALLALSYPEFEVIVINDGSNDQTLDVLIQEFHLFRSARYVEPSIETQPVRAVYESMQPIRLVVVDKENGGKADALNAGVNVARYPLVCAIDTDSLLDPDALERVVRPFILEPEKVIAVGGTVRIANGCEMGGGRVADVQLSESWLARFQVIEYCRAFLGGRLAFSALNCLMIISGAFGLFLRKAIVEVGGYKPGTMGEDMDLVVRLHKRARESGRDYKILFQPDPICWTEAPESLRVLRKQRKRWQWGTLETLWSQRNMLARVRYGTVGLFAFPYFLLFEGIGPIIECLGYIVTVVGLCLGAFDIPTATLFLGGAILNGIIASALCVILAEMSTRRYRGVRDLLRLLAASVLENLGMRQLQTLWRAEACVAAFFGNKQWGHMERKGFNASPAADRVCPPGTSVPV